MELTDTQIERYSRHIILQQVGLAGQEKLLSSKVLIIGAGGLGSPAALYLAAAGVGAIGIVDCDKVEISNLQRQIIHDTSDLGRDKVLSAVEKLQAINPDVDIRSYPRRLTAANIVETIHDYDFVIDGTDNFPSKFLINDACYFSEKPYSHAGILRFSGQTMTVLPGRTMCLRCLFDKPPRPDAMPSCSQAGVLGVLAGVIGCLQATEAVKYILGQGELLTNALLTYDALQAAFRKVRFQRNPRCRLCGAAPSITALHDEEQPVCDMTENSSCCNC